LLVALASSVVVVIDTVIVEEVVVVCVCVVVVGSRIICASFVKKAFQSVGHTSIAGE